MSVAPLAIFISLTTRTFTTFFVRDRFGIDVAATPGFAASHQQLAVRISGNSGNCGELSPFFPGGFGWKKRKKETTSGFESSVFSNFFDSDHFGGEFLSGMYSFWRQTQPKKPTCGLVICFYSGETTLPNQQGPKTPCLTKVIF